MNLTVVDLIKIAYMKGVPLFKDNFDESVHPRDESGKFTETGDDEGEHPTTEYGERPQLSPRLNERLKTTDAILREKLAAKAIERSYGYSADGDTQFTGVGSEHGVTSDVRGFEKIRGGVFSHSHPSGGSFSGKDILVARKYGLASMRAVTAEGVFVLGPPKGGWGSVSEYEFGKTVESEFKHITGYSNKHVTRIVKKYDLHYRWETA